MKQLLEKCAGDCFHCTLPDCHSSTYPPYRRTPFEREQSAFRHEKILRARREAARRRCRAAGLAPEQLHQDKEDAPCNTETPAPTGAAAATTDGRAAPEPSQAAETTTTSASGADADTSMSLESGTSGPSTSPARGCPAGTGDAASGATPAASPVTTPSSLPAFDYTGLDAQTVQDLHLAEREFAAAALLAWAVER